MSSTTYLQLSHARKKLSLHYKLKRFDKFLWNGLEIREVYSRFRQNGKHFVLTSQTTQLRRETSNDGYRKWAGKYFQLPLAVVDSHRLRILRSLIFRFWRLTVNFWAIWRLTVNPVETLKLEYKVLTLLLLSLFHLCSNDRNLTTLD